MTVRISREALEAKLADVGLKTTPGDHGEIQAHGCAIRYSYNEPLLMLTVKSKPWYYPMSMVDARLKAFLEP